MDRTEKNRGLGIFPFPRLFFPSNLFHTSRWSPHPSPLIGSCPDARYSTHAGTVFTAYTHIHTRHSSTCTHNPMTWYCVPTHTASTRMHTHTIPLHALDTVWHCISYTHLYDMHTRSGILLHSHYNNDTSHTSTPRNALFTRTKIHKYTHIAQRHVHIHTPWLATYCTKEH